MDEKEKDLNCEEMEFEQGPVQKLEPANICLCDAQDEVIVIPVSAYKHLVRCEAAVDLIASLLGDHGKYDNTRAEIIEVACRLLQKEGAADAK